VAGGLQCNPYFDQKRFSFKQVSCSTFSFSKPLQVLKGVIPIQKGVRESQKILEEFSPDCVVGFGSFVTLPVLVAALLKKIPLVLHEQNAIPGKVNKLFSRFAHTTATTFPHSHKKIKGRSVEVSFPMRAQSNFSKQECFEYFQLNPEKKTVLIFGGSKGAERLNMLVLEAMKHMENIQILHFAGDDKRAQKVSQFYAEQRIPACVKAFEPFMDRAMRIADMAITRAGAGTISELIEYAVPAMLIPYPYATEAHQERNGAHFVDVVQGGVMHLEPMATSEILRDTFHQLMKKRMQIKQQIQTYKQSSERMRFSQLIKDLVQ